MKVTQMPPVHAANLVANSGNASYGVDVINNDINLLSFNEGVRLKSYFDRFYNVRFSAPNSITLEKHYGTVTT